MSSSWMKLRQLTRLVKQSNWSGARDGKQVEMGESSSTRVDEVWRKFLHCSRKFSSNRDVKGSSQFVRSHKCNHVRLLSIRNRASNQATQADRRLDYGSTLKEAVADLIDRVHQGTAVDSYNYVTVLQGCLKQKDFELLKQVHDCIKKSQMEQHPYVANNLLKCYIGCGRLQNAQEIFDKLVNTDTVTWNIMIGGCAEHNQAEGAIEMYKQMRNAGGKPCAITYLNTLKACTSPAALNWGKYMYAQIIQDGLQADVRVCNALVNMFANCGSIEDARAVFGMMEKRDVVSWNVIIGGLAQHGLGHEAFSLFLQMQRENLIPDSSTYLSLLNPCSSKGASKWVKEVHAHAMKANLDVDVRVGTALVHMYAKSGHIEDARALFNRMERRNVICWSVMIGGLAQHGLGHEAFSFFCQMEREGFRPNVITYVSILNPSSSTGALEWVKEVHTHARRAGLDVDVRLGTALVQMYAKSGSIDDARVVFGRMETRNVITWNVMIDGLAEHGLGQEAFSLFLEMQRKGFTPDSFTYTSILNPCLSENSSGWVREVHAHALKAGIDVDVRVGTALVHMYAKIGTIDYARQVFDKMLNRDVICWTAMIGGLAQHGHGREALQLFEKMKTKGVKPDRSLFVAVLSACSHAGLVEEGRLEFVSMRYDHGIEPAMEHYTCMVDTLGRAGHLEEAKHFILNMPIKPDKLTWTSLLGACRVHRNIELAGLAATECLKLEPTDASPYVLMSNVYAAVGSWDKVSLIRTRMHERGIRKDPGSSWIEVDNKVHHFVVGDTSHPEAQEIQAKLSSLSERLKAEGYTPDTRLVLRNLGEEDKESAMCSHSEKLAIAYGLMHVPAGKAIRVFKNLRICADCHLASKLISKITGREIVARDANRFHHFKDGSCSCGDFW